MTEIITDLDQMEKLRISIKTKRQQIQDLRSLLEAEKAKANSEYQRILGQLHFNGHSSDEPFQAHETSVANCSDSPYLLRAKNVREIAIKEAENKFNTSFYPLNNEVDDLCMQWEQLRLKCFLALEDVYAKYYQGSFWDKYKRVLKG